MNIVTWFLDGKCKMPYRIHKNGWTVSIKGSGEEKEKGKQEFDPI